MKRIAQAVSVLALAGTILPPCLFFADELSLPAMKLWLLVSAVAWLAATPLWMEHKTS